MTLDIDFVETVHDEIIAETGGLAGYGGSGRGGLEAALCRVINYCDYVGLDDVYEIAALYAEVIACGHIFNDGNKRTALTCALTYLQRQGFALDRAPVLEDAICWLAQKLIVREEFAAVLSVLKSTQGLEAMNIAVDLPGAP